MESSLVDLGKVRSLEVIDPQSTVRVQFGTGALLFARSGSGAAIQIVPSSRLETVETSLTELYNQLSLSGERIEYKIVGDAELCATINRAAEAKKMIKLGEANLSETGSAIYFFPSELKLRIERVSAPSNATPFVAKERVRRVFVVDDSPTIRKAMRATLETHPLLRIVGETGQPTQAEALISELKPDVITLDIHMPEMDGITLLKRLSEKFSIPVVMISSISKEEGVSVLKALELGAVDYIEKPNFAKFNEHAPILTEKILAASDAKLPIRSTFSPLPPTPLEFHSDLPIVIGASTGGTEALRELLQLFPKTIPPILIVQHIPAVFSEAFAKRLNELLPFEVREAKDRDGVKANTVLIAPGGLHMTVKGSTRACTVHLSNLPAGYPHQPAVDVLFESAAKCFGSDCSAVILTGMGRDGAKGMLKLRQAGALTVAQDEQTSVVYGMPKAAAELGAVEKVLPLQRIAGFLSQTHGKKKKAAA